MSTPRIVLALDFGSSEPSVALAREGRLLAVETAARRAGEPAPEPLELTARVLAGAGLTFAQVEGVVALRGPGSFTGLRIACATALGLAAAGLAATAVSTFEALALAADGAGDECLAVVDALRGEWFVQPFGRGDTGPVATGEPRRIVAGEGADQPVRLVGAGSARLRAALPGAGARSTALEPGPLAPAVAVAASLGRWNWDPAPLAHPLYLRPAAVTPGR